LVVVIDFMQAQGYRQEPELPRVLHLLSRLLIFRFHNPTSSTGELFDLFLGWSGAETRIESRGHVCKLRVV